MLLGGRRPSVEVRVQGVGEKLVNRIASDNTRIFLTGFLTDGFTPVVPLRGDGSSGFALANNVPVCWLKDRVSGGVYPVGAYNFSLS